MCMSDSSEYTIIINVDGLIPECELPIYCKMGGKISCEISWQAGVSLC